MALMCWTAMTASPQEKLSVEIKQILAQQQALSRQGDAGEQRSPANEATVSVFIKFHDGAAQRLLSQYGCQTLAQIGDIYIANVPMSRLCGLADEPDVVRIETQTGGRQQNDISPNWTKTTNVNNGKDLPQAFTGKGVLVGILDGGLDVSHPAFFSTDGSTYRVKRLIDDYHEENETIGKMTPLGREYATEQEILAKARTGDTNMTHGTHCLSIAAGSGYDTDYRGVAYDADIFAISTRVGMGSVSSPTEVARMKRIFDYADEHHQPCVITYSIGFDYIPRDAELFREALQGIQGPGKLIVAAAGNENTHPTYVEKPKGVATAGARLIPGTGNSKGKVYILSEEPFRLKLITTKMAIEEGAVNLSKSDSILFDSESLPADTMVVGGQHAILRRDGSFYTLVTRFDMKESGGNTRAPLLCLEGTDAYVRMYTSNECNFENFTTETLNEGRFQNAERSHNIQIPGTFDEILTVGALTGRQFYVDMNGEGQRIGEADAVGTIVSFSSVGPTLDGRIKPDVVAPGVFITAAGNSYNDPLEEPVMKFSEFRNRKYPWITLSGTSMATPHVAGIVALWLQADPTLTPERLKEIISATSTQPVEGMESHNSIYGYGLVNAYAGMCKVLGIETAIKGLPTHQPSAVTIRPTAERNVRLQFDSAPNAPFTVRVYTVGGQLLNEQTFAPTTATSYSIAMDKPQQGICVVQVVSSEKGVAGSELIRF